MNYIEIIKTCAENKVKTVKIDGDAVEIEFFPSLQLQDTFEKLKKAQESMNAPMFPDLMKTFDETAKKAFENDKNNLYNETIASLPLEDPMEYEKLIEKLGEDVLEDEEDEEI